MDKIDNNRSRLLMLLRFFQKQTDDRHSTTVAELIERLQKVGIKGNRNTIRDDIVALNNAGYEILGEAGANNSKRYHYGTRIFDLVELKILADAITSSRFISERKSRELVEKLCLLTSDYEAQEIRDRACPEERVKTDNPQLLYIIDAVDRAIESKRKIRFQYKEYNDNKELVCRNDGEWYVISPYTLIWREDRYYMLGYSDKRGIVVAFRVDRMCIPDILDEAAVPKPRDFSASEYINKSISMYNGEEKKVTIECPSNLMKKVIDEFGLDFEIEHVSNDRFRAEVEVNVSKTFFGWLFTYAGEIDLIGPPEVKEEYERRLQEVIQKMK
ncbi:MAG: WYL domain-containing protein [Clostridiales bacterium]|nr:WYL domain-containing protein [Clostridiales bacterium]